jgi:hypothetical protein
LDSPNSAPARLTPRQDSGGLVVAGDVGDGGAVVVAFALADADAVSDAERSSGPRDVVQQCGEPLLKESICVPRQELVWLPSMHVGAPAQQVLTQQCVAMEEWTYHRGQGNFMSIARFYNGTIESARDGIRAP